MKNKTYIEKLAEKRTALAEERTHLAYIRTGLSILLAGLFFIGFFEEKVSFLFIGYISVILGILFLVYGFYYQEKTKKIINKFKKINGSGK